MVCGGPGEGGWAGGRGGGGVAVSGEEGEGKGVGGTVSYCKVAVCHGVC